MKATAKLFQISVAILYRWRKRPTLERTVVRQCRRKLNPEALRQPVWDYPEARLQDRAKQFGVYPSAIGYAFKRHRMTVKKQFRSRQRDHQQRQVFLARLRQFLLQWGRTAIIYLDESGFELAYPTRFACSARGQPVYGKRSSQRRSQQNLIAARTPQAF